MAMTRARVVVGSARFAAAIEAVIRPALQRSAGHRNLRTDVLEMHALFHATKKTGNPWDIKHVRGGLIDIEFVAQYLMLRHAHERPCVIHAATAEALRRLCAAGFLRERDLAILSEALWFFKAVLQSTRIGCMPGPLPENMSNAFACHLPDMMGLSNLGAVEAKLVGLQDSVLHNFARLTSS